MKKLISISVVFGMFGCAVIPTSPPERSPIVKESAVEYRPYLTSGTGSVVGQASLTLRGGNLVKAAGHKVTLDPATSVGDTWWAKSGRFWTHRGATPSSPEFLRARKSAVADAEGKFSFTNLPDGKYYVLTEVTWEVGYKTRGGLVGKLVEVKNGQTTKVILSKYLNARS